MSSCAGGYPPPILWMESPCFHGDAGAMGCKILFAKGFAAESSAVRGYGRFLWLGPDIGGVRRFLSDFIVRRGRVIICKFGKAATSL